MTHYFLILFLTLSSLSAYAAKQQPQGLTVEQEDTTIAVVEATGLAIFRHDQAAAVATDAALKLPRFKGDQRVDGWITEEQAEHIVVTFIDQTPAALYRVAISKNGVASPVTVLETPTALTPYEAGAAAARKAALAVKFQPCAENYNSVVLPSKTSKEYDWLVYLIPGATQGDVLPIGGAYRMGVRNNEVVAQRGYTKSCLDLKIDARTVSLVITHLLDPTPTEMHVFWSIWANKAIVVATRSQGTTWLVNGDKIKPLERKPVDNKTPG